VRSDVCAHRARGGPAGPAAPAGGAPPPRAAGDALGLGDSHQRGTGTAYTAVRAISLCHIAMMQSSRLYPIVSWCVSANKT
jgi:hypothetical protein